MILTHSLKFTSLAILKYKFSGIIRFTLLYKLRTCHLTEVVSYTCWATAFHFYPLPGPGTCCCISASVLEISHVTSAVFLWRADLLASFSQHIRTAACVELLSLRMTNSLCTVCAVRCLLLLMRSRLLPSCDCKWCCYEYSCIISTLILTFNCCGPVFISRIDRC